MSSCGTRFTTVDPEHLGRELLRDSEALSKHSPGYGRVQTIHRSKLACLVVIGLGLHTGGGIVVPTLKRTFAMNPEDFVALRMEIPAVTKPFAGERYELQFFVLEIKDEDGKLFQSNQLPQ